MNFPHMSFRSPVPSLAGICLVLFICLATRAFAEPICQDPSSAPKAAVRGLWATGNDLEAELTTDPALGYVTVLLRLDESNILASTTVPVAADGVVSVVLPGALAGSETREIRYHLEATDVMGNVLMQPYPFLLLFDCLGTCVYHLMPGVWTKALVVTEQLSAALAGLPDCDLMSNLQTLIPSADRELSAAAQTLEGQLERRGLSSLFPGDCRYEWQAVIPFGLGFWNHTRTANQSANRSHTVSQLGGLESGATACYLLQGTSLMDQLENRTFPGSGELHPSTTQVEMSILCLEGNGNCSGCEGQVDINLDFDRCLTTEAMVCNWESTAIATAEHALSYRIGDHSILDQSYLKSSVRACQGDDCEGSRPIRMVAEAKVDVDHQVQTPAEITLTGETRLSYTSDGHQRDGATYSLAESNFEYHLTLTGSDASCTESEQFRIYITAPVTTIRDDGIKMRRWWPDEPARAPLPAMNPPLPEVCLTPADAVDE